jgi:hypothetical protein
MNLVPLIPCRQLCDQKPGLFLFLFKQTYNMGLHYTLFPCLFDFLNNREDDDAHEVTGKKEHHKSMCLTKEVL